MNILPNKKVLILGGHGDIGRAIAINIEKQFNYKSIIVGREEFDLSLPESIDSFIKNTGDNFDILIHSAGWNIPKKFEDLSMEDLRHSVDANLMGFLHLTKKLLPYWQSHNFGRIVVISSIYGFLARSGRLPYVIAKHGLIGAVKTLSIELAKDGVLVNAVSPGYIDTRLTSQNNTPETIKRLVRGIPIGRMGTPEEIAKAVCFLASPDNTYITGHNLVVDGGYTIGGFQE